jgi:SPP1 gp7 family putative phage head morphogenesis protein
MTVTSKRLYDVATRKQALVEGVKRHQYLLFLTMAGALASTLNTILSSLDYDSFNGLPKAKLTRLLNAINASQNSLWTDYTGAILGDLQKFSAIDLDVSRNIWANSIADENDDDEPLDDEQVDFVMDETRIDDPSISPTMAAAIDDADKMWNAIRLMPMGANGMYVDKFVDAFATSAQASIVNIVRRAYVNGFTVDQLRRDMLARSVQGTSSQIQRIEQQASAVINTAYQHVHSVTDSAVQSALFGRYAWYSVIDTGTSDICRSRNLHVYEYGAGPLPPAHVNCRSHIAPIVGGEAFPIRESFDQWSGRQPSNVRQALNRPLSLDDYSQQAAGIILTNED